MKTISDDAITYAIRGLETAEVQRPQQELIEGMSNQGSLGYSALRELFKRLELAVAASTEPSDATASEKHLAENLRVIEAAYDASGGDLQKTLHWFRTEQLAPFGQKTAEQLVAAGQGDDVIRLIDSLYAGAAG